MAILHTRAITNGSLRPIAEALFFWTWYIWDHLYSSSSTNRVNEVNEMVPACRPTYKVELARFIKNIRHGPEKKKKYLSCRIKNYSCCFKILNISQKNKHFIGPILNHSCCTLGHYVSASRAIYSSSCGHMHHYVSAHCPSRSYSNVLQPIRLRSHH